ncbi:MAG TPA: hypothetical protein VL025_14995, partial [Thermoanaerobaculia bacterium]|nr:hypothetical protein [Thermoanaerobaculia bacterium]
AIAPDTPSTPSDTPAPVVADALKGAGSKSAKAGPAPARRHVVFFFDTAFTNFKGFQAGQKFAQTMMDEVSDTDLIYLMTHDFKTGFKQQLGPLPANASGKSKFVATVKKMKPEAGLLDSNADYGMGIVTRGTSRNGVPVAQTSALYMAVSGTSHAQIQGSAKNLAAAYDQLATQFERIKEPKLLVVLSQGISPVLYWEGSDIALQHTSNSLPGYSNKRFRGIHELFEEPMRKLGDSGAMTLYVNLDDKVRGISGDTSMQHMARTSGGLYMGGVDVEEITGMVASSTSAYYEAGYYLAGLPDTSRAKVEVVVERPGVRTWSAGTLKTRATYRGLSEESRRLLIVDLIECDAEAVRARSSVRLDLKNLPGNVLGRNKSGKTLLRYEAGWPQELAGRKIELYNVVIEPTRQAGSPNILSFDRKDTRLDAAGNIEVEVPEKTAFVWGIVAVEPDSGKTWYRRFHLQGKVPKP